MKIDSLVLEQLEMLIGEMKRLQAEHPKAVIKYDPENKEIKITYPLPKDFPIKWPANKYPKI